MFRVSLLIRVLGRGNSKEGRGKSQERKEGLALKQCVYTERCFQELGVSGSGL